MAIGMMLVIVTGGIDLSVGSVMGLSSLVAALAFQHGPGSLAAVAAGLVTGMLAGAVNGLLVTRIELPPFIATLGIGRGLTYIITEGVPVTPDVPDGFTFLGQGYLGFIPFPVIVMAALAA